MLILCLATLAVLPVKLTPEPQWVEASGDWFELTDAVPFVVADDATDGELLVLRHLLSTISVQCPIVRAGDHEFDGPAVYIGEPSRNAAFNKRRPRRLINGIQEPGPNGYRLAITPKAIAVAGTDPAGTLYGLQTLAQAAASGNFLPCMEMRDEPDLAIRGVFMEDRVSRTRLRQLAALKCNFTLFRSDDFYSLDGRALDEWQRIFNEARRLHMEPVPMLRSLNDAVPLLRRAPVAAEGVAATDHFRLERTDWAGLSQRNVLHTASSPIRVKIGTRYYKEGIDFEVERGSCQYPYPRLGTPWLVRRTQDSAIPPGAPVTIEYSYVPPGTTACCPSAPETQAALRASIARLAATLRPRYIHIGHGEATRLNSDRRCADQGPSDEETFLQSIRQLHEYAQTASPAPRLILWGDMLAPGGSSQRDLGDAAEELPEGTILALRNNHDPEAAIAWAQGVGVDVLGAPTGGAPAIYGWCKTLAESEAQGPGILSLSSGHGSPDLLVAMNKGWSVASPMSAWPEGLNAFFGTQLWEPTPAETRDALWQRLEQRTLANIPPAQEREAFTDMLDALRRRMPEGNLETVYVENMYTTLLDYLEMEAEYTEKPRRGTLRKLEQLVEDHAARDPDADPARTRVIIDTIREKGMFVPSTILFGRHLLPFRPMQIPRGHAVLEVPVSPRYEDTRDYVHATCDLMTAPGPICRADFETVGAASVTIAARDDGGAFNEKAAMDSRAAGGVRGPLILGKPFQARTVRLTAHAPAERAVLRNVRLFALKGPAAAKCPLIAEAPHLDGLFTDSAWRGAPAVAGFVSTTTDALAEAPTTVRLCYTRRTLYVAARMHEPRMSTLVAGARSRDDIPPDVERFELSLNANDRRYRFAITPGGATLDMRDGDAGWDTDWRAAVRREADAWTVELEIPLDAFEERPKTQDAWRADFLRRRRNVTGEDSAWAWKSGQTGFQRTTGRLTFE